LVHSGPIAGYGIMSTAKAALENEVIMLAQDLGGQQHPA